MRMLLTKSYNTVPTIIIVPLTLFLYVCYCYEGFLHCEFVCLPFLQDHRETFRFLTSSGVHLVQTNFHFLRTVFSSQLKSKVGNILPRIQYYGLSWISVPVPHTTQCKNRFIPFPGQRENNSPSLSLSHVCVSVLDSNLSHIFLRGTRYDHMSKKDNCWGSTCI